VVRLEAQGISMSSNVVVELTKVGVPHAFRHSIAQPTQIFVPHLTPSQGQVIGDAVFRSPAIIVADAARAVAYIADIDDVRALHARGEGLRAWLDYDHPKRTITIGIGAYREEGHVFYVREEPVIPENEAARLRLHVVEGADPTDAYGMAARWMWNRWGHAAFAGMATPAIDVLTGHVLRWAFSKDEGWGESVWQPITFEDGTHADAPVFIVDVTRHPSVPLADRQWREPRSVWNQAWFSTQRCANGLFRLARQTSDNELAERAKQMTQIALSAPQSNGLFPSVLIAIGENDWRWTNSNRRPPSASDTACHTLDAAFTCRMLMEWHALTGDARARAYVDRFAARLLTLQRPSGAFPGWVEPDGRVPAELAEGPESAVSAALFFELGLVEPALATLPFLAEVIREGRWEDFETYYSCAPWGADRIGQKVERNGVFKQNTLSIFWCAEAFLLAWRKTGKPEYLATARRCVDELCLYQAVWDPPWLPAPAIGGFGVMNADCEWNDARQSLFAPLLLELGEAQKDDELIERGVAAVRASFSMLYCPENPSLKPAYERRHPFFGRESYGFMMENQGHSGVAEPIGTFTIFTWGNGSAVATAALVRDRFPAIAAKYRL